MHPRPKRIELTNSLLQRLARVAWRTRENAFVIGNTKVGCAVIATDGRIFSGCNVEHRFRCHDVHAEVNAITSMIAAGSKTLFAVLVAAERKRFTPCGGCMDWIMQFGSERTAIAFQAAKEGRFKIYSAKELMPHYPK